MSGTYRIGGVDLLLQPTTGRWMPRKPLGIDGNGHPIYPGVREFEMRFQLGSPADYNQLQTFFESVSNTGTVIVDLPIYGHASYTFTSYTGCVLREPDSREYFSEHQTDFVILVAGIRT
uniref:Uncharacterized protein n=1 Tax=viral metagenome TaxID=1070528 RepID=A0A6M3LYF3_9ZZZZ